MNVLITGDTSPATSEVGMIPIRKGCHLNGSKTRIAFAENGAASLSERICGFCTAGEDRK